MAMRGRRDLLYAPAWRPLHHVREVGQFLVAIDDPVFSHAHVVDRLPLTFVQNSEPGGGVSRRRAMMTTTAVIERSKPHQRADGSCQVSLRASICQSCPCSSGG